MLLKRALASAWFIRAASLVMRTYPVSWADLSMGLGLGIFVRSLLVYGIIRYLPLSCYELLIKGMGCCDISRFSVFFSGLCIVRRADVLVVFQS